MDRLNVFHQFYSPWKYPRNWIRNIRLFFRQFKWAYQRATRGYCDPDWWDLDSYYLDLFSETLNHMADNTISWPGNEEFPEFEDWQKYLRTMAQYFYKANEANDYYEHPNQDIWWEDIEKNEKDLNTKSKYSDAMITEADSNYKRREADLQNGLHMLEKNFGHLWD